MRYVGQSIDWLVGVFVLFRLLFCLLVGSFVCLFACFARFFLLCLVVASLVCFFLACSNVVFFHEYSFVVVSLGQLA